MQSSQSSSPHSITNESLTLRAVETKKIVQSYAYNHIADEEREMAVLHIHIWYLEDPEYVQPGGGHGTCKVVKAQPEFVHNGPNGEYKNEWYSSGVHGAAEGYHAGEWRNVGGEFVPMFHVTFVEFSFLGIYGWNHRLSVSLMKGRAKDYTVTHLGRQLPKSKKVDHGTHWAYMTRYDYEDITPFYDLPPLPDWLRLNYRRNDAAITEMEL